MEEDYTKKGDAKYNLGLATTQRINNLLTELNLSVISVDLKAIKSCLIALYGEAIPHVKDDKEKENMINDRGVLLDQVVDIEKKAVRNSTDTIYKMLINHQDKVMKSLKDSNLLMTDKEEEIW